jgi:hypothetical protein
VLCIISFSFCRDDKEPPKDALAAPSTSPAIADEPVEQEAAARVTRASVKKIPVTRNLKRLKKAKGTDVSLETHASTISPNDVSSFCLLALFVFVCVLTRPFSQALLQRFVALGTECAEYLKAAKSSEGTLVTSRHYFSFVLILWC